MQVNFRIGATSILCLNPGEWKAMPNSLLFEPACKVFEPSNSVSGLPKTKFIQSKNSNFCYNPLGIHETCNHLGSPTSVLCRAIFRKKAKSMRCGRPLKRSAATWDFGSKFNIIGKCASTVYRAKDRATKAERFTYPNTTASWYFSPFFPSTSSVVSTHKPEWRRFAGSLRFQVVSKHMANEPENSSSAPQRVCVEWKALE